MRGFECHWVNANTIEIFNTVDNLYYEIWYLCGEYYPCRDSPADVAMCPGDKRPLFHGYKEKFQIRKQTSNMIVSLNLSI